MEIRRPTNIWNRTMQVELQEYGISWGGGGKEDSERPEGMGQVRNETQEPS